MKYLTVYSQGSTFVAKHKVKLNVFEQEMKRCYDEFFSNMFKELGLL